MRLAGIAGGAFQFCTRDAFEAVGGFDERLFGAEDAALSWALKREGRFVVLWRFVVTSGRRMQVVRGVLCGRTPGNSLSASLFCTLNT
jgi:cellulose synthase/poly-beta-1,6-N-acetylglucosamine synthase-like glycosyltransferase